jgi:nicotinamidase-related amidase
MDKVLFVVDMQEMYVGKTRDKSVYTYEADELIDKINKRILAYKPEEVFYIISIKRGLFGGGMPKEGTPAASFPGKLKIVSKNIYEKSKPDAFSNVALEDFTRARNVKEIEMVGVDGGVSVGNTIIGAIECGMKVIINEDCIGTISKEKERKCREKFKRNKVTYMHEGFN